jgi:DNA uptake protein ComE-like DNA-binding protein
MSSSHEEARSLTRGAFVLLLISVVRYGGDVVRGVAVPEPSTAGEVLDSLRLRTRAAIDEGERRSRPLDGTETIDPNLADGVELDRLPGVGPATAAAIVSARDDGLVFRRPDDMLAVRGIGPATIERLTPHLRFERANPDRRAGGATLPSTPVRRGPAGGVGTSARLDLNSADAAALEELPGVGPALAARILEERRKRPFGGVEDLVRVRGIGTATVESIRGLVVARRRR